MGGISEQRLNWDDHWKTWRIVSSGAIDTFPSEWNPSDYPASKSIIVHPGTAVAISLFGSGTAGGTVDIVIVGWMSPSFKHLGLEGNNSPGPGFQLIRASLTLGSASTISQSLIPDGQWDSSLTWIPVTAISVSGSKSLLSSSVIVYAQSNPDNNLVLLPTVGFSALTLLARNFTNVTNVGALWRVVSRDWVV